MNILVQLPGVAAMVCLFLSYQQKNRKGLIMCKLSADVFWALHYALLGAFGGMIPNLSGIFRELVFVNREDKKWANFPLWPVFFIVLNFSLGLLSFKSPINLLPITASAFVTVSLWLKNTRLTRIISVPVSLSFLIYDIFAGSYIGIVNESMAIISILIYFLKKENKNDK